MTRRELLQQSLRYVLAGGLTLQGWSHLQSGLLAVAQAELAETDTDALSEIRMGMSLPLSHPAWQSFAIESYRGFKTVIDEVNDSGGVNGYQLQLIVLDDAYELDRAIANTRQMIADDVLCLANYLGVSTAYPMLQSLKVHSDILLIAPLSGASVTRQMPYDQQVFHVRPSYERECQVMTETMLALGRRRLASVYQLDDLGRAGYSGIFKVLRDQGLHLVAEAAYAAGDRLDEIPFEAIVEHLLAARIDAVICSADADVFMALVVNARNRNLRVPLLNISDSWSFLPKLVQKELVTGVDYTTGVILASLLPLMDSEAAIISTFKKLFDKWQVAAPEPFASSYRVPERYSPFALEGFVNARVVIEGLRASDTMSRGGLRSGLESLRELDLGLGHSLSFGPDDHQGLKQVDFIYEQNGRWAPVQNWRDALGDI